MDVGTLTPRGVCGSCGGRVAEQGNAEGICWEGEREGREGGRLQIGEHSEAEEWRERIVFASSSK